MDFRNAFSDINYAHYVIWNNKDIRIDNKSVFYKKYADCGIMYLNDLLFSLDNIRSFEYLKNVGLDSNLLHDLPYGCLCLRTSFPLSNRWNLIL